MCRFTRRFFRFAVAALLLCALPPAWAFHTIPCSNSTIQGAIDSILAEERANGGADGVDYYIALGGGLVFNEPVVINDNGTPGGVVIAIIGGLAIDPNDPNQCAASPGVFDGSLSAMSGGGRFHQSVIQVNGHATVYLDALTLTGASLGGSGGGISFDGTGSLELYGVNIAGNTAGSGAGIHANGSVPGLGINFHDLVLPNGSHIINFVQQNTATNGQGGGISFDGTGSLELYGVNIAGNTAGSGAGIHANGSVPGLGINFHDLVLPNGSHIINFVQQNTATNGPGGGMDLSGETFLSANDGELIVGSNAASGDGGGIAFRGRGSIQLGQNLQLVGNTARNGGGIFINPSDPTDAYFYDGVFIGGNTAQSFGGGVYAGNNTNLHADAATAPTQVFFNHVTDGSGCGGGIFVGGPAKMTFAGSVTSNDSSGSGGGICGKSGTGDGDDVDIELTGASSQSPVKIANNSAAGRGGGIYCRAYNFSDILDLGSSACTVTASLFAIDANSAVDGAAIFGETNSEGTDYNIGPGFVLQGDCNGRAGCNEVAGNLISGSSSGGSTIVVEYDGDFDASNVRFQANSGAHLLDMRGDGEWPSLATALITGNHADGTLVEAPDRRFVIVRDSTVAHNDIAGAAVVRAADVVLRNDIFDESVDAVAFTASSSGAHDIVDVLTNPGDGTMVPAVGTILHGTPQYVDAAAGDYHLAPYSLGIDVGFANADVPADLDGQQRDQDEVLIDNVDGPRDLGAFEFNGVLTPRFCTADDEIFCSPFE